MENTESEFRSRSPGVGVPESDVKNYGKHGVTWKTRSLTSEKNMENTESYGKHGVRRKIWKTRSLT